VTEDRGTIPSLKPLVLTILLLAGTLTRDEVAAIAKLASCRNPVCLKDAYFTLHSPNRGATFFYHARMLQLFPHMTSAELALLETLPRDAKEADALLTFATAKLDDDEERELRDAIADEILPIFERTANRHHEFAQRLEAATPLIRDARERSRAADAVPPPDAH
jgi:hypothetical protein